MKKGKNLEALFDKINKDLSIIKIWPLFLWRSTITDEYLEKIGISERQRIAIKFIKQKGRIQRSEYVELCSCSAKTAYNDLQDLVNKDILIAHSKGKKTYYTLRGIRVK